MNNKVDCPGCEGTGKIPQIVGPRENFRIIKVDCPRCNGSGKIPLEEKIKDKLKMAGTKTMEDIFRGSE